MFVDTVKVQARAGKGGNGCIAFSHEPFKPKGGPCGGDGGKGGDVILQADHDINNLIAQYYSPHLHAKDGRPGEGKGKKGFPCEADICLEKMKAINYGMASVVLLVL